MGGFISVLTANGLATSLAIEEVTYQLKTHVVRTVLIILGAVAALCFYVVAVLGVHSLKDLENKVVDLYKQILSYIIDLFLDLIVMILQFFVDFSEGVAEGIASVLTNFSFPSIKLNKIVDPF